MAMTKAERKYWDRKAGKALRHFVMRRETELGESKLRKGRTVKAVRAA